MAGLVCGMKMKWMWGVVQNSIGAGGEKGSRMAFVLVPRLKKEEEKNGMMRVEVGMPS